MGLELKNPLIKGSSALTENLDGVLAMEKAGVGAVVLRSLFEEEIVEEMQASLDSMNTSSDLFPEQPGYYEHPAQYEPHSSEKYLDLIAQSKKRTSIPIIASINCITADEWTFYPRLVEQAGADALELNVFLMPSDTSRKASNNEQIYFDIAHTITQQVSIPVALKVGYFFSNVPSMLKELSGTDIDALVLFNRFYSPDFDIDKLSVTSSSVLSAPSDLATSLRWISIMSERVTCDLCASTGVHDGPALVKQLLAGADAVQAVSTFYRHGPRRAQEMLDFLSQWMNKKGYRRLSDFRGMLSQSRSQNPADYERTQFQKYFRGYRPEHSF